MDRFYSKVSIEPNGCHLWTAAKFRRGYGSFKLGGKQVKAHRLAWEWANGAIPEGMMVCHSCDTPACVNPAHLFLGTHADNMRDVAEKGRRAGTANHRAKLSAPDVQEIKRSSLPSAELERIFDVSQPTISRIRRGPSW